MFNFCRSPEGLRSARSGRRRGPDVSATGGGSGRAQPSPARWLCPQLRRAGAGRGLRRVLQAAAVLLLRVLAEHLTASCAALAVCCTKLSDFCLFKRTSPQCNSSSRHRGVAELISLILGKGGKRFANINVLSLFPGGSNFAAV